jgi:hypothetical protein
MMFCIQLHLFDSFPSAYFIVYFSFLLFPFSLSLPYFFHFSYFLVSLFLQSRVSVPALWQTV